MNPDYRAMLLATLARLERLIAEVEALTVDAAADEAQPGATQHLAALQRAFADAEQKLKNPIETPSSSGTGNETPSHSGRAPG